MLVDRKEPGLSTLMEMEPRSAGTDEVELLVEFEKPWDDLHDRAECPGTRPGITVPGC
jgi:hypothetical protein